MESDILQSEVAIPPRPTDVKAYSQKQIEHDFPGSNKIVTDMINTMKDVKASGKLTGSWSLDAPCHNDWRTPNTQKNRNQDRDFRKWSASAHIEEHHVNQYRKHLLDSSDAAAFLRNAIISTFQPFVKPYSFPSRKKKKEVTKFTFPDTIFTDPAIVNIDVDIDDVIDSNDKVVYINKACSSIASLKRSIERHPFAKRTPYTTDVDPLVLKYSTMLQKVYFPSSLYLSFIQLITRPSSSMLIASKSCP